MKKTLKAALAPITELWRVTGTADTLTLTETLVKRLASVKVAIVTDRLTRVEIALKALTGEATDTVPKPRAHKTKGKAKGKAKGKPGPKPEAKLPKGTFTAAVFDVINLYGPVGVSVIAAALVIRKLLPKDGPKNYDRVSAVVHTLKAKGKVDGSSATGFMVAAPDDAHTAQAGSQAGPGTVSLAPSAATAATEE